MPSVSKKQRAIMCIALAMKRGKTPKSYSPEAAKIADEMTEQQLIDFCETPVSTKRDK
jgi:hypothetical protein